MLLFVAIAAAACPVSRTVDELRETLVEVESAWGRDMQAFGSGIEGVRAILPCVNVALDPQTAGAVHRAEGLAAFSVRDMNAARRSFAAARAADPAYEIPSTLAPVGNPLRAEWDALVPSPAASGLPVWSGHRSFVDGQSATLRAVDRPAVVQYLDDGGRAQLTALVAGDAPVSVPARGAVGAKKPVPWGWIAASAGASIVSGALFVKRAEAYGEYLDSASVAEANTRRTAVNGWAAGAAVTGVAALSFGTVAVVQGVF